MTHYETILSENRPVIITHKLLKKLRGICEFWCVMHGKCNYLSWEVSCHAFVCPHTQWKLTLASSRIATMKCIISLIYWHRFTDLQRRITPSYPTHPSTSWSAFVLLTHVLQIWLWMQLSTRPHRTTEQIPEVSDNIINFHSQSEITSCLQYSVQVHK